MEEGVVIVVALCARGTIVTKLTRNGRGEGAGGGVIKVILTACVVGWGGGVYDIAQS